MSGVAIAIYGLEFALIVPGLIFYFVSFRSEIISTVSIANNSAHLLLGRVFFCSCVSCSRFALRSIFSVSRYSHNLTDKRKYNLHLFILCFGRKKMSSI